MSAQAVTRLADLMHRQRKALLSGDLAGLQGMPTAIDAALRQIARKPPDPELLDRVRLMAARNLALVASAKEGVSLVRTDRHGTVQAGLSTYGSDGGRVEMKAAPARTIGRG